nr:sliding clamp DNA polymerase accessory protein [uncultured Mediterranean phage uvMED]
MKLSEKTLSLLKNFGSINQSILFKEGNKLRTISIMKNILAEAEIAEDIPQDFGIYDLNQFLNSLSVSQSPELDFSNNQYVMIRGLDTKAKYFFADPSVIISPPEKEISLPTEDLSFELNTQQLDRLLKAASVLQLPDVSVVGEAGVVRIVVWDKKNDTSNDFSIIVGKTDSEFSFNFKVENIKIIPGRYEVTISEKLLSKFTSKDHNLCYYIALEPDSICK